MRLGTRVVLSDEAREALVLRRALLTRAGTVVGVTREDGGYLVVWDGTRAHEAWPVEFLVPVLREDRR